MVDSIKFILYLILIAIMMPVVWLVLMLICSVSVWMTGQRSQSETHLRDEEILLRELHD
jgi:hypothetical protein